jgi:prepilin-type N-terminal cleavage/methylation domain-containing protein
MIIKRLLKNEKGYSLIELTIGLLILGIIGAAFFSGMNNIIMTSIRNDRQAEAMSLAQSQLEYIKQQPYNWNDTDPDNNLDRDNNGEPDPDNTEMIGKYWTIIKPADTPANFEIYGWDDNKAEYGEYAQFAKFWDVTSTVEPKDLPDEDFPESDTGIQVIKIVIKQNNNEVIELYGYKADHTIQ